MDCLIALIKANDVKSVSQHIFRPRSKLGHEDFFVQALSAHEENIIIESIISAEGMVWFRFMCLYVAHHSLRITSQQTLVNDVNKFFAKKVLIAHIEKHGFIEEIGMTLCQRIRQLGENDKELLNCICKYARQYYPSIERELGKIGFFWANLYQKSCNEPT